MLSYEGFRLLSPMLLVARAARRLRRWRRRQRAKLGAGDVAVVGTPARDAQPTTTQALAEERASLKQQGQAFPKAGSTEYAAMQTQIVNALVERGRVHDRRPRSSAITVTPAEVAKQLDALKKK